MKTDLRIIKTQESLRNALLILLKTKPLESINIAELCRCAKINRGTFYLHYQNVHGVFESYFEEIIDDLRKSYEEPYHQTDFNIQNLKSDMIIIFHHVKRYEGFYQIIFDEANPVKYYYKLFHAIRKMMKEMTMNSIDYLPDEKMEYFVSYQTNAIMGILVEWHSNQFATSPDELNEYLYSFSNSLNWFPNKQGDAN
ncbi:MULTISPECIES: TetR/AcrR family transcriptional regulator [unclassified Psychrobacillus]|uniref:TetR/AcrR family transcriptional regulator n=1 Tax=unclassified Psychrobacillus TaxID=2636677 RepID=UPI00146BC0C6|nr:MULTISPECIES: TetR/AcrR family transcriptional regulator [unclassified Psychrobacillus]MCM3357849.1 TetR/AcrR family transcriptional regulator [Psychrobacillus sp. MER TA 171]NME07149.1 TetR/AcrR family transcriptional regulator [Psychrobacillus sp. BL-248-WT-3]